MRIVLVSNNFTPYTGGVVSSIQALVRELQKEGHQVQLITLGFLKRHDDPAWVKRLYCPMRFKYKTNHMALPWRPKAKIAQFVDAFKPDIVHVHHPFLLGSIAQAVAKQRGIPVVFTYHTIYEAYLHYVPLPRWLVGWYVRRQVLAFCSKVSGIIAPSSYIKNYLKKQSVGVPMVIIPSGLLPCFIASPTAKHITDKPIQLLIVGRMVKEKNIEAGLKVAQELVMEKIPFQLKCIGYGAEYDELKAYAYDTLRLSEDQVTFIYKPPKEVIAQAYKDADLFLFTSPSDTQALVLAEAMAASTPVLALDGPGQRDIIKQGVNGYILRSPQAMVSQIKQLIADPALFARLCQGAYQTAQNYRPEVMAKRHSAFYERIRSLFCKALN